MNHHEYYFNETDRRVLVETCDEEDAILPPLDSLVPNVSQVHTPQSPSLSRVDIARSPAVSVFDSRLVPAARPSFTLAVNDHWTIIVDAFTRPLG